MALKLSMKRPELVWKTSPIRINQTPDGYWAKGVLSVTLGKHGNVNCIPYGACAIDPEQAMQKALSEMAERVVWFITFVDMHKRGSLSGPYNTFGWAAHVDEKRARDKSVGEYLERQYFETLIHELSTGTQRQPGSFLEAASMVDPALYGKWDNAFESIRFMIIIPLYFPQIGVYVVYAIAVCCLGSNVDVDEGVVFGMGNGYSFDEAFYSAKFELFLVMKALSRLKTKLKSIHLNNLAKYEAEYFYQIYNSRKVYRAVEQLLKFSGLKTWSMQSQCLIHCIVFTPDYEVINFSWLQPKWLKPLSRYVYYTAKADGHIIERLKEIYGSWNMAPGKGGVTS